MTSIDDNAPSPQPAGPWQYSLKTLLLVTLGTAVALGIVVSSPDTFAIPLLICLAIAVPAVLTVVAVYGSGYQRTFAIGALFPACTMLYATGWLLGLSMFEPPGPRLTDVTGWLELFDRIGVPYRVYTAASWLLAIVIGTAAVVVRQRLEGVARSDNRET